MNDGGIKVPAGRAKYPLAAALLTAGLLSCQTTEDIKRDQYFAEGYQLYTAHCANCHQDDGKGLANLYPPIHRYDYATRSRELICLIKNGLSGEIEVAGRTYNRPMPANPTLADIEIAEIVTYISNTWGKQTDYTATDTVKVALSRCE